jgi:hypothetical protein
MRTNANKCEQMRTTHGSRPDIDGVDVWDMLVNPAAYTLTSAHETLVLSHEVMLKGNLKIMTSQRGDTRQGFDPFENTWQHRDGSWCAHVLCFAVVDSLGRFHCWSRLIVSIDSCAWSNPQLNASLTMGVGVPALLPPHYPRGGGGGPHSPPHSPRWGVPAPAAGGKSRRKPCDTT